MKKRSASSRWLLLTSLTIFGCSNPELQATGERPVVLSSEDIAEVTEATLRSGVTVTGTLDPYRRVEVRSQVAGTIAEISGERGDQVRSGQQLVRVEAQGIQSLATSAEAAVAAAQVSVSQAERERESAEALLLAGAMSDRDFRTVETAHEAARAQLAAARAQHAGAAEQARHTVIRAPIDGEIAERSANEGEAVRSDETLFTVVNTTILELSGQVPVVEAVRVREGQTVEFSLEGFPGQVFAGVVSHVSPVADRSTRQVGVTMRLDNPGGTLIAGLFANGRIITGIEDAALVVPMSAIRNDNDEPFVWLLADDVLVRRSVELGTRSESDGLVSVRAGLSLGDRIVVSPGEVTDGAPFRTVQLESSTIRVAVGGE